MLWKSLSYQLTFVPLNWTIWALFNLVHPFACYWLCILWFWNQIPSLILLQCDNFFFYRLQPRRILCWFFRCLKFFYFFSSSATPTLVYMRFDFLILLDLWSWHLGVLSSSSLASSFSIVLWWTHVFQVLCASSCSILLPLWSLISSYSSWLRWILIIHSFIWSSISFESRNSSFSEDYHKDALSNTIFHIV